MPLNFLRLRLRATWFSLGILGNNSWTFLGCLGCLGCLQVLELLGSLGHSWKALGRFFLIVLIVLDSWLTSWTLYSTLGCLGVLAKRLESSNQSPTQRDSTSAGGAVIKAVTQSHKQSQEVLLD
ncbi:hypothetical protein B0H65DRAFT_444460 [Neurospora tetraspora]|uniref:Uncharacterized protein n=1 Tax=Neurospora tetraspora TaxID=94610 RepID=A0AAE0JB80_9PEZI|nr:hypothetical protein B0H65DRAFT_444460 [Neurospora tetraspora]